MTVLPSLTGDKKRLMRIGLPLLIVVIIVASGLLLVYSKTGKFPSTTVFQKKATVSLKTEYKNPFDKNTQYVNPFETYKNPFTVAK